MRKEWKLQMRYPDSFDIVIRFELDVTRKHKTKKSSTHRC